MITLAPSVLRESPLGSVQAKWTFRFRVTCSAFDQGAPTMSTRPPPFVLRAHRWLAIAVFVGVLVQIYAAGLMLYGVQGLHRSFGYYVIMGAIVTVPLSLWAYGWRRVTKLQLLLTGLLILQPVFVFVLGRISPFIGGFHALDAAVATLIAWEIVRSRDPREAA